MSAYRSFSISLILTIAIFMFGLGLVDATAHDNIDRSINHQSNRFLKIRSPGPSPQPASDSDNVQNGDVQQVSPNSTISVSSTSVSSSSSLSTTSISSDSITSTFSSSSSVNSASSLNINISQALPTGLSTTLKSFDANSTSLSTSTSTSIQSLSSSTSTKLIEPTVTTAPNTYPTSPPNGVLNPSSIFETDIVTSTSPSQSASAAASTPVAATAISKPVLTIIVIASCIGGAILIWTIIRKWKFRPSSQFEDRMQPIDWQSFGNDKSSGLERSNSNVSHESFHSGPEHEHPMSYNQNGISDFPAHDFTPGPANYVSFPPNGGSYVDSTRETSHQHQWQR